MSVGIFTGSHDDMEFDVDSPDSNAFRSSFHFPNAEEDGMVLRVLAFSLLSWLLSYLVPVVMWDYTSVSAKTRKGNNQGEREKERRREKEGTNGGNGTVFVNVERHNQAFWLWL